jgi:hypothetical protein
MKFLKFRRYLDFGSRHSSFDERNQLIASGIGKERSWILDVGSNIGQTSNFLASKGHFVIGVEKFEKEHKIACARSVSGTAFMRTSVTPEFIQSTVNWDAILLLSVLHRIHSFEGEEFMRAVLKACGERANQLFIEGSTRQARYMSGGHQAPAFTDFDTKDAERWHQELFQSELGNDWQVSDARVLAHSKSEPHRLFFHAKKTTG